MPTRFAAAFLLAGLIALPAQAQLGSVANPPRQNLYHFAPQQRLDNGLGARAETHLPSATALRHARRTARRHPLSP